MKIWGEFGRVRNQPILSKKPGQKPIVLKMADLGMCQESFQTLWNALYMLGNVFPTTFGLVHQELGWIPTCPKSADFIQKAWATAHGFEDGGYGYVPGIVPNSLKRLVDACKWISNYFRTWWLRFGVNSEGPEIGLFWAKSLGYSPWFWRWRIWVCARNRSKLSETPCRFLQMESNLFDPFTPKFKKYILPTFLKRNV